MLCSCHGNYCSLRQNSAAVEQVCHELDRLYLAAAGSCRSRKELKSCVVLNYLYDDMLKHFDELIRQSTSNLTIQCAVIEEF